MGKIKKPPAFVNRLETALVEGLMVGGIPAEVGSERAPMSNSYRVLVLAPRFKRLSFSERQDLVWRVAGQALSLEEQLRISMILTMTPDEAEGWA